MCWSHEECFNEHMMCVTITTLLFPCLSVWCWRVWDSHISDRWSNDTDDKNTDGDETWEAEETCVSVNERSREVNVNTIIYGRMKRWTDVFKWFSLFLSGNVHADVSEITMFTTQQSRRDDVSKLESTNQHPGTEISPYWTIHTQKQLVSVYESLTCSHVCLL